MEHTYWKSGTWNAVCAVCGFQYKADQLRKRWDGFYVCEQDWEPRHVLDFFKVKEDKSQSVPWSQKDINTFTPNISAGPLLLTAADLKNMSYTLIIQVSAVNISITLPSIATLPSWVSRINVIRIDSVTAKNATLVASGSDTFLGSAVIAALGTCEFIINFSTGQWIRNG